MNYLSLSNCFPSNHYCRSFPCLCRWPEPRNLNRWCQSSLCTIWKDIVRRILYCVNQVLFKTHWSWIVLTFGFFIFGAVMPVWWRTWPQANLKDMVSSPSLINGYVFTLSINLFKYTKPDCGLDVSLFTFLYIYYID